MQEGLGLEGVSPDIRACMRPDRLLPTVLGTTRRNDVMHCLLQPAGQQQGEMEAQQGKHIQKWY
jgi:hypothetical protein